jgi:hypothetical protein
VREIAQRQRVVSLFWSTSNCLTVFFVFEFEFDVRGTHRQAQTRAAILPCEEMARLSQTPAFHIYFIYRANAPG